MNWITTNWRIVAGIVGTAILIIAIFGMVAGIKQCSFNSGMNQSNKELQNLNAQATNINAVVANLEDKKIEAQANANAANADLQRIQNEVNKAKQESNTALVNVNTVNNANYKGTNANDARSALCRAFPDDPDCQR